VGQLFLNRGHCSNSALHFFLRIATQKVPTHFKTIFMVHDSRTKNFFPILDFFYLVKKIIIIPKSCFLILYLAYEFMKCLKRRFKRYNKCVESLPFSYCIRYLELRCSINNIINCITTKKRVREKFRWPQLLNIQAPIWWYNIHIADIIFIRL